MTTNPTPLPPEGVTEEDRKALDEIFSASLHARIKNNDSDEPILQILARHRIAATSEPVAFRYRFKDEFAHMAERLNSWVLSNQNPELSRTKAWRDLRIIETLYASTGSAIKVEVANARLRGALDSLMLTRKVPLNPLKPSLSSYECGWNDALDALRAALDQGAEG